jgi:integrase
MFQRSAICRTLDLARGRLTVEKSKSDAGTGRVADLSPSLLDELKLHRADAGFDGPDDFVFATRNGARRERSNIIRQILRPAIRAANKAREKAGLPLLPDGITNPTMRRTFCPLLYEAGASPSYVMSQMGRSSAALAFEVYAKKMERTRDTGERLDALLQARPKMTTWWRFASDDYHVRRDASIYKGMGSPSACQ